MANFSCEHCGRPETRQAARHCDHCRGAMCFDCTERHDAEYRCPMPNPDPRAVDLANTLWTYFDPERFDVHDTDAPDWLVAMVAAKYAPLVEAARRVASGVTQTITGYAVAWSMEDLNALRDALEGGE